MKKLIVIATLFLTVAVLADERRNVPADNFASEFQTVPVMGNSPGIGGTFQTYVALFNPTSSAYSMEATLYSGNGFAANRVIVLAAGELKTYSNFLSEVFNFTGSGAVVFRANPGNRFIVNTEVRTSGTRYGTTVPALEFAGSSSRSYSAGITVDSNSRTNVGCFNQSDVPNVVTATVFDNTGKQQLGTATLNLAANSWGQTAITAIVSGGYVQFDPQEAAVCYAVVIDNATNDGRFISAAEYKP
jgi:hypothetical protein